jgi:hypothetical protein
MLTWRLIALSASLAFRVGKQDMKASIDSVCGDTALKKLWK